MQHRTLGNQGLEVSAIGYGAMGLTMAYGPTDEGTALAALRRAHDLGVTLFDTAEMYGGGTGANEALVGRAVKGFREDVVLATKFGVDMSVPAERIGRALDSRPDTIRRAADTSLRHLGVDHIDVLYQHRVDPAVPVEEVAGTVKELIDAGKVRYFGLSEAGPETLRRAHAVQPVSVLQTEYSLFERDVEQLLPVLDELGIGLVAYSPLGRGFITGTAAPAGRYPAGDLRNTDPRWQPGNFERNAEAVCRLAALAAAKGATVAQLALAWLLSRGEHLVPIPGTRDPRRLEENVEGADLVLTGADLAAVDEILPRGGFGARYAEGHLPTWI
ncbi:aldo/keto reductase [Kitasatospora cineracea]|uniref:Aryl-alcohol dehydrogenase-like predicted oxidoreductase n=1 Tax=Kitasatospora cineracea TaxID=88074 RepID=A0A3N4SBY6_9ACTN|nr:aldo/keto reductase [Kitasatospora cineracea]ROR45812.1 aryl-alcohol dehydrogenase-like predicted oxidoreductase [Kitasatospora cineracea]RPE36180.1 aryl-alcohol dehydrogenase-like predicted oxidoreductase [Kitasatospora cineracea]